MKKDRSKDDASIAPKTEIFYSKFNFIEMAIMLVAAGFGIYLIINDQLVYGVIATVLGGYLAYKEYLQATNSEVQIYIDSKGMRTVNTDFKSWSEIRNEKVTFRQSGKRRRAYLSYEFDHGFEELLIDNYNTSPKKLESLMQTYKARYKKSKRF